MHHFFINYKSFQAFFTKFLYLYSLDLNIDSTLYTIIYYEISYYYLMALSKIIIKIQKIENLLFNKSIFTFKYFI